ncbi:membrane-spanning 4-domains subfamily A member 12-like isoform X2 [Engraulis encrasicolus]
MMAVSVSTDLSVTVADNIVEVKLTERQTLMKSIEKNECKALGVSQVMLGLLIMLNSITLLCSETTTEVVAFGVPLWTGLVFVTAGSLATMIEKHTNRKYICYCIITSAVAVVAAVPALIIYIVDIARHPEEDCVHTDTHDDCSHLHYSMLFRKSLKTTLAMYTVVHAVISSIVTYNLHGARRQLDQYTRINN